VSVIRLYLPINAGSGNARAVEPQMDRKQRRKIVIRPLVASDAQSVHRLLHIVANGPSHQSLDDRLVPSRISAELFPVELPSDESFLFHCAWVATATKDIQNDSSEDSLIGFVKLVTFRDQRATIAWLLVDPSWRRQGIGRQLATRAIEQARILGIRKIEVQTLSSWRIGVAFWMSLGFSDQTNIQETIDDSCSEFLG